MPEPVLIESPRSGNAVRKYGLADHTGREVLPPEAEQIRYFFEGLAGVRRGGRYGFVDVHGKMVVAPTFGDVDHFSSGFCAVHDGKRWTFVDAKGTRLDPGPCKYVYPFSEGLAAVANDKLKWGFVDTAGRLVIPHTFDDAGGFSEGVCAVKTRKGWGFIDRAGEWIIEPRFRRAWGMKGGRAQVVSSGKEATDAFAQLVGKHEGTGEYRGLWGVVDRTGRYVVAPRFTYSESALSVASTIRRRTRGPHDSGLVLPVVEGAAPLVDGTYRVKTKRGFRHADADGNELPGGPFVAAGEAKGGHALVVEKWGEPLRILDVARGKLGEKRFVASHVEDPPPLGDGVFCVAVGEDADLRFGYVDVEGEWVIPPRFLRAATFEGGLARVVEEDGVAYVDRKGARVWPRGDG